MKKLLLTVATSALFASGAMAADIAATYNSTAFDWDGFYVGVGVTKSSASNIAATDHTFFGDFIVGFNQTQGNMLFGAEGWIGGYSSVWGSTGFGGGAEARFGYLAAPEVLLYVSGGGYAFDSGDMFATLGAGVEFAVADDLSLDLEYKYWGWSTTAWTAHSIGASLNWHF